MKPAPTDADRRAKSLRYRITGTSITALLALLLSPLALDAQTTGPLAGLVEDATRLDQPSAAARFDALVALLDERRLTYETQTFPNPRADEVGPAEGRNVVITIGDGEDEIIVGAHADAAILQDGSLSHGMVDNASSAAVLVRLAEALRDDAPDHRVRIVLFDLEELGLLGSRHYAQTLDRDRVVAMLNLDINGYGDTVIYGPASATGNDSIYDALRRTCAAGDHACLEFDQFPPGDDRSFQAAGIPNVSLGTLPGDEARQLRSMLNAAPGSVPTAVAAPPVFRIIHTPNDTADKLDAQGMTLAYEMVLGLVRALDQR